ncbi:head completion/stabilization protein [Aeromonas enteropelogenes]|uniref:head completion/stabilization protein n=1 Tax=Aeromonas enteropelogenes TaxID=29489 RepID=UPI002286A8A3|nr:head completion/stabilization protein [Aeromonas enteropelogenes]MCZ0751141.1 head completion/stabilization protein [Aeromonas enteropelogenes]
MFSGRDITYSDTTIRNNGFWPDVSVSDFERRRHSPAEQDPGAITAALLAAVTEINGQLANYQTNQQANGYASAAEVPGYPAVEGGNNGLVELYLTAVFARAKAQLLPEFATVTEREAGNDLTERVPDTRQQLLAESQFAVRAIKGKRRTGAVLI